MEILKSARIFYSVEYENPNKDLEQIRLAVKCYIATAIAVNKLSLRSKDINPLCFTVDQHRKDKNLLEFEPWLFNIFLLSIAASTFLKYKYILLR